MSNYVICNGELVSESELYHHGVKGMRWGVRKKLPVSDTRKKVDSAKQKYKQAKKAYNKSFDKAYNYSSLHPVTQWTGGKNQKQADRNWDNAFKKADAANKAQSAYKKAKNQRKQQINKAHEKVNANASLANKLVFNEATRKKAAKYMVDNNMSMSDATKRANGDAIRNTMIALGAIGAISVASNYIK